MNFSAPYNALCDRVNAVPGIPFLHDDNTIYEPDAGTPFYRTTWVPSSTSLITGGTQKADAILNISLFYPLGQGTNDLDAMSMAIQNAFPIGTKPSVPIGEAIINSTAPTTRYVSGSFFCETIQVRLTLLQPR